MNKNKETEQNKSICNDCKKQLDCKIVSTIVTENDGVGCTMLACASYVKLPKNNKKK